MTDDRHIAIGKDAIGNVILSGDDNRIVIIQQRSLIESEPDPSALFEAAVVGSGPTHPKAIGPNPYKGLSAFQEQDAEWFFGREALVASLYERYRCLHEAASSPSAEAAPPLRLLPILGPSGSGKSSVARAGLIPELARRPLSGMSSARVAVFTPGTHPVESLANVLARLATGDPAPVAKTGEFAAEMRKAEPDGRHEGLRRIADALPDIHVSPLIILVDQFEEIYSLCKDPAECGQFIENLLRAASDRAGRVFVIITLRSDFLGQTQSHAVLNHAVAENSVIVPAMDEAQLRRAISMPAEKAGHPLDDATVDLLIEQTRGREGALPMLEFALTRIWEGMARGAAASDTLKQIGGVGGALASEAQRLFEGLAEKDRIIAKRAFLSLVQLGEGARDTRRRAEVARMVGHVDDPDHVRAVVRHFSKPGARLITLSASEESNREEIAEITHEALFEHWGRMAEWLDKEREDIRFKHRLESAAEHWDESGRPPGLVWESPDLDLLIDYRRRKGAELTETEERFYKASVAKKRRAWLRLMLFVSFLGLLLVVSGSLAIHARRSQKRAEAALNQVEDERKRALQQKELALTAAKSVTYELVDELADIPGTLPTLNRILRQNADVLERIYRLNPKTHEAERERGSVLSRMGDMFLKLGNTQAAVEAYQKALEISKRLAEADPQSSSAQRDLTVSYNKLGDVQLQLGNTQAAVEAYQKALEISKRLAEADPQSYRKQRDLMVSFYKMGTIHASMEDPETALKFFKDARDLAKLLAADEMNQQARNDLAVLENRVQSLQKELGAESSTE